MSIPKIIKAIPKANFDLLLTFNDGTVKKINMKPFINVGVSKDLLDVEYFSAVKVVDGYIMWENGYDFCPNFLYQYNPLS